MSLKIIWLFQCLPTFFLETEFCLKVYKEKCALSLKEVKHYELNRESVV